MNTVVSPDVPTPQFSQYPGPSLVLRLPGEVVATHKNLVRIKAQPLAGGVLNLQTIENRLDHLSAQELDELVERMHFLCEREILRASITIKPG